MKRSPMKRASVESVKAWRARTAKPLRPRSLKMQREYAKRREFVAAFLTAQPRCQFDYFPFSACGSVAVDVHEVIRRSHGAAIYPGQEGKRPTEYRALCRQHHDFISVNPNWAKANGYEIR